MRTVFLLSLLAPLQPADAAVLAPVVEVPRVEESIEMDGELSEPVWASAAVLTGFWQHQPSDDRPAVDSTKVLVWYAPTAIYFGIRAYAPQVRATLADRDKIDGDDYVAIILDTYDDQRQAFVFGVNPLGIQSDGILQDANRTGGFFGGGEQRYAIDRSPDFVFQSRGRVTDYGYEVEVRIPFKSLRYQSAESQTWGINVLRRVQYTGYEDTWAPVRQTNASFLAQSGKLTGLTELRRGLVLDITPEATASSYGEPSEGNWDYGAVEPSLGGNVRWGVSNNLTLNATVNPDFSQVEADAAQLQFDPRNAVFFEEKRPFFLDGIELFESVSPLIYTRRISDPLTALKLTGKVASTSIAALTAIDEGVVSDHRLFNVVRARRDLSEGAFVGGVYTDKIDGDDFNRVLALDGRFIRKQYTVTAQGAVSSTRRSGERHEAPHWIVIASRSGRRFGLNSSFTGIHPNFEAQSGFVSRTDVVQLNFRPRLSWYGGGLVERIDGSVNLDGLWQYDEFFDATLPDEVRMHFNSSFSLRGGWNVGGALLVEAWRYPEYLYPNYFVMTPSGPVPFRSVEWIYPLDLTLSIRTPRFQNFSGNIFVIGGRDLDFHEWAPSNIFFIFSEAEWRPTEQVRVSLAYDHQQYIRPSDWSTTSARRVPRLKLEYQLTRALFLRFVGQYDAFMRDRLRDEGGSGHPIVVFNPTTGAYEPTTRVRRNNIRADWLISYRPVPGTVFFLGYGSSLQEPQSFRFRGFERTTDGFFMKLSYLIRANG